MSGYASINEIRDVIKATLTMEGRNPADYNISGIVRDAFYHRGPGYGYGAGTADTWREAVTAHRRPATRTK